MLETVDLFVCFCDLLAQPENHIEVRTGQFVGKEYNTRLEADMVNEVSRLLTSLPKYTAYAKIVTESGGKAGVWKGKVRTLELTEVAADAAEKARAAIEANMFAYTRPREQIRAEIEQRQARWRQRVGAEAPPVRIGEKETGGIFRAENLEAGGGAAPDKFSQPENPKGARPC